jgi:hypothetical protein
MTEKVTTVVCICRKKKMGRKRITRRALGLKYDYEYGKETFG